jgi:hypothetical protein
MRPILPPPPPPEEEQPEPEHEYEDEAQEQEDEEEPIEVPPPLPRGRHTVPAAPAPEDDYEQLETPEIGAFEHVAAPVPVPAPAPRRPAIVTGPPSRTSTLLSPTSAAFELKRAQEILDEDEGGAFVTFFP